jgi:hypothetical protein
LKPGVYLSTQDKKPIIIVVNVRENGRLKEMDEDLEKGSEAYKILTDLCDRIERMCRYSPLDEKEVEDQSMKDRDIILGLYRFHKSKGEKPDIAARKARVGAIRLVLNEVFS